MEDTEESPAKLVDKLAGIITLKNIEGLRKHLFDLLLVRLGKTGEELVS